jgi:preprotein translocase subunit SecD
MVLELVLQVPRAEGVQPTIDVFKKRLKLLNIQGIAERFSDAPGDRQIRVKLPPVDDMQGVKGALVVRAVFEVREVKDGPFSSQEEVRKKYSTLPPNTAIVPQRDPASPSSPQAFLVSADALLGNSDLQDAIAAADESGQGWRVDFNLKRAGSEKFGAYTQANIGQRIALLLDGVAWTTPVIQSRIDGKGYITGMKEPEARAWAILLNSGPLPMDVEILEEHVIH